MVRFLASFGGPELKKVVKTILSKLLTDHFAITVSFTGKGQNAELAFDLFTNVHHAVINSTRMNSAFQNSTESEINTIIKDWLRMAKDRSSGRQHKKKVQ
ncbi:unnamed protein product [Allacma fusca]|uniref:Uncharacterized protein n=1 Tax=Allacma fusca TaxID=39272 RepID=A0A8J2JPC8_9HEXA|nr:unnamed protein product [Allacma fusca]